MLKKLIAMLITASLFVGCGGNTTDLGTELIDSENTGISRAKIVDINENSVLLCGVEHENSIYSLTTMGVDELPEDAIFGSIIDIYFDGYVMESYPAQISNIDKIEVVEQEFDIVGLFIELIKDLYYKNDYLIETNEIGLALVTDEVLTKGEEYALLYMATYELEQNMPVYEKEVHDNDIVYDNDEEIVFFIDSIKTETGIIFDVGVLLPVAVEEYEGDFVLMNWYENCQIIINGDEFEYEYIHGTEYNDIF